MKKIFMKLKKYLLLLGLIVLLTSFLSLLNIIGINNKIVIVLALLSMILLFFIISYKHAQTLKFKGIITGLFSGLIILMIMFLLGIIFFNKEFHFNNYIYYLILLLASITGGIIGKNKSN